MTCLKKLLLPAIAILFIATFSVGAAPMPVPAAPQVAADNYLLLDYHSGQVLAEKDADVQIEPASITKLMTAYVVFNEIIAGRLGEQDLVTISEKAWRMGGSRMYVEVGTKVSVEDLLKGLIIQSGNDASVALAEHVAGTEDAFVELMNQYALKMGMTSTNFMNSTGWPDPQHLTTARDIATLAATVIRDHPEHYKWYAVKEFTYNNIKQYNRNKLLWSDKTVDGMKTGHTESAGYCLVSSALRGDMRLIAVVLGTKSEKARASVSQSLLNFGFRFYETHKLYTAGEILNRSRIWQGETDEVSLGLLQDMFVTIPRGAYKSLDATLDVDANIEAPLRKGAQVGVVRVMLNEEEIDKVSLVALENIDEGNLFRVLKDYVLKMFN
jgi:D-alanyl-D-alanine carboxypeptidase (penicillin-binding protein 5/6)